MPNYSVSGILEEMRRLNCRVCEIEGVVFTLTGRVDSLEGEVLTIQNTLSDHTAILSDHESRITVLEGTNAATIHVVSQYSDLPDPNTVPGQFYLTENSQGIPWINYRPAGAIYYSTGPAWITSEIPLNASQILVDQGTDNTRFLTPQTFTNSAQLAAKADKSFAIAMAAAL